VAAFLAAWPALAFLSGARADTWFTTDFSFTFTGSSAPDEYYISFDPSYINQASGNAHSLGNPVQTYGNGTAFDTDAGWQSLPVSAFDNTTVHAYTFSLNSTSYWDSTSGTTVGAGMRFYISKGALSGPPNSASPGTTPYGIVEMFVNGDQPTSTTQTGGNIDISYVDGVSLPITTTISSGSVGGAVTPIQTTSNNPVSTQPDILGRVIATAGVPEAAVVKSGTTPVRVISSQSAPAGVYHNWDTLMTSLQGGGTPMQLKLSSYTSPTNSTLTGYNLSSANFGYVGNGAASGFGAAQTFSSTATFQSNLNPSNNAALNAAGITDGTSGVVISGSASAAGTFQIYVTSSALNAPTGVYGSNPGYVVVQNGAVVGNYNGIQNDLTGKVVGDLLAGMVYGWTSSETNIADQASKTGTNLAGVTFSASTIGGLSAEEYFFLLSLAGAQGKLADWIGAAVDDSYDDYDPYAYAIALESGAYGTAFGDRLQGAVNPDTSWYTSNPAQIPGEGTETYPTAGFVNINIDAGEDPGPIPEPSEWALLVFGGIVAGWTAWRARMARGTSA